VTIAAGLDTENQNLNLIGNRSLTDCYIKVEDDFGDRCRYERTFSDKQI